MTRKLFLLVISTYLAFLTACNSHSATNQQSTDSGTPSKSTTNSIEMIKSNAAKSDLDAQVMLAMLYETGFILPKDTKQATDLYAKAAEKGHAGAQFRMGLFYFSGGGHGITQDVKRSMDFYTKAAEQGHKDAQIALAQHYKYNFFGDQDLEKAKYWSQKAASEGNGAGYAELAGSEIKGYSSLDPETNTSIYIGDLQDFVRAEKNYIKAAELGDANSQQGLCLMYRTGLGVAKNLKSAEKWCERAALNGVDGAGHELGLVYEENKNYTKAIYWYALDDEKGYQKKHDSRFKLGNIYYHGIGVNKDYKKAFEYYEKAAFEDGLKPPKDTKYFLGLMYQLGQGTPKDLNLSINWYEKAANEGHIKAQYNLAMIYLNDINNNGYLEKGMAWLETAADQGNHADAQYQLGKRYSTSIGVSRDYGKAANFYAKAARQNHADAQNNLATLYYFGRGVKEDYAQAANWYGKAAAQKHADAQNSLALLYNYGLGVPQSRVASYTLHNMALNGKVTYENESTRNLDYAEKLTETENEVSQKLAKDMMKPNNFLNALTNYVLKSP
jgi:uncharacterized protein